MSDHFREVSGLMQGLGVCLCGHGEGHPGHVYTYWYKCVARACLGDCADSLLVDGTIRSH